MQQRLVEDDSAEGITRTFKEWLATQGLPGFNVE
ncbi:bacteriocin immunity protein [Pseudomonas fluorescens]|nr:bacteriocin immunity protein [Pseudomonas fluorescens]